MAAGKIRVHYGELNSALTAHNLKPRTTLEKFLDDKGVSFSSSIRVNAKVAAKSSILRNGDIVTSTEGVSGGSR